MYGHRSLFDSVVKDFARLDRSSTLEGTLAIAIQLRGNTMNFKWKLDSPILSCCCCVRSQRAQRYRVSSSPHQVHRHDSGLNQTNDSTWDPICCCWYSSYSRCCCWLSRAPFYYSQSADREPTAAAVLLQSMLTPPPLLEVCSRRCNCSSAVVRPNSLKANKKIMKKKI